MEALALKASFVLEWLLPAIGTYGLVARPLSLLGGFGFVSIVGTRLGHSATKALRKGSGGQCFVFNGQYLLECPNTERKTRIIHHRHAHELAKGYEDPKP
jgi:hypothetical protein